MVGETLKIVQTTVIVLITIIAFGALLPLLPLLITSVLGDVIKIVGAGLALAFLIAVIVGARAQALAKEGQHKAAEDVQVYREQLRTRDAATLAQAREIGLSDAAEYRALGADMSPYLRERLAQSNGFSSWEEFVEAKRRSQ